MFDEMSIKELLQFNQENDSIESFEELGRHSRASSMANHALVFMIIGLCKGWKYPKACCLTTGSTKSGMLDNFLMEVLNACHNTGLEVVSTTCDMGVNSVKALKLLGVSEKTHFFRFRDQDIAAEFDPPRLFKCAYTLLLKHEVMNVWVVGCCKWTATYWSL
jgi:hypothetical protein